VELADSARMATRSFASRLDSGSSKRNTLGLRHDGPADRHALPLAARQLLGPAVQQLVDAQDVGRLLDALVNLLFRNLRIFSPKPRFSLTFMWG